MILILLGAPGAGKGTQAQYLCKNSDFLHISTGELLRKEITSNSFLGKKVQSRIESGLYVDDEIMNEIISNLLTSSKNSNIIFDGYPRTLNQALAFDSILSVINIKVDLVFNFKVDLDNLIDRISGRYSCTSCGMIYHKSYKKPNREGICDKCQNQSFTHRQDDYPEILERRLESYLNEIKEVDEFYRKQSKIRDIDTSQSLDLIQIEIREVLKNLDFII